MSRLQSAAGRVPRSWSFGQWPLRRKLAAALVLPVLLASVLGGLRIQSEVDQAREFSAAAVTSKVVQPLVEYNSAVQTLATSAVVGGPARNPSVIAYQRAADTLSAAIAASNLGATAKAGVTSALANGKAVQSAVGQAGALSVVIDKAAATAVSTSAVVGELGLTSDAATSRNIVAIQDTIAAHRSMTAQQLSLNNQDDAAAVIGATGQVGSEASFLTRLKTEVVADNRNDLQRLTYDNFRRGVTLQGATNGALDLAFLGESYRTSGVAYTGVVQREMNSLEASLNANAVNHRNTALVNSALVGLALLATLLLVLALIRSLLTPIRAVRAGALDIANKRLPEAVAAMRDGEEPPAFEPIPVTTTEEMGQLARAVDDLHTQALVLAGEQARLRVQVGNMFETLSRRSTSLIDQQLTLIERLESDEEDPKRLQSLFRLDHLAARMRRNSDSLLVLAGTSTRRGVSGSVSVSDAIRAAVSEVENYERIDIGDTSNDHVLGAVGSDLIHLVAEVIDNALSYSPPTSRVALRGARTPEGGLLVEVADRGLGMPPKELAALNDQLAHGGDITADTARRMGLYVVGSLAKRHGIAVRLRTNGDDKQGITVSIHLPAGLLADSSRVERPTRPAAAAAGVTTPDPTTSAPPTSAVGGTTKAGLPTRVRGASGATASPVPGAAKRVLPTRTPGAHGPTAANGIPAVAKPVIEGADAVAEEKPTTNGKAAEDHQVNGKAAHEDGAAVNGKPSPAPADEVVEPVVETHADDAPSVETPAVDGPAADATQGAAATAEPTPDAEAAPVSKSGLPVRKPRATGITEYREFEDAPSTKEDDAAADPGAAKSGAPAAKGRLSWLPGRGKAAEAARQEAEADEPRQMPSNLSAWLDHRAKLVEAAKNREDGPTDDIAYTPARDEVTDSTGMTETHVPDEWVAEAVQASGPDIDAATPESAQHEFVDGVEAVEAQPQAAADAPAEVLDDTSSSATVDPVAPEARDTQTDENALPTRVPGATASAGATTPAPGTTGVRPAMRAHNTSFFGARRARDAAALAPLPERQVAMEPAAVEVAPAPAEEVAPVAEVEDAQVVAEVEDAQAVAEVEVTEEDAPVTEAEAAQQDAPAAEIELAEDTPVVEVHTTDHDAVAEDVVEPVAEPVVEAEAEAEATPRGDLNDTPIFRAMMSRWLTDDPQATGGATWSSNEADQAWSAAARIEETEPLEESAAGLPKRRPGNYLIPGTVDEPDDQPAAPAASRRDPEAIRRNLNRHKNGVSSARTEAQDGTHREEADVHH